MKIRSSLSIFLMLIYVSCYGNIEREKFYSLAFLRDYKQVRKELQKVGFQKISFKTSDNLTLSGLFLSRPHATCNVVVCAGWLPGRKEGMATFYDLLPEYCNVFLFDARGRGESEGPLFWNVWRYGMDEYRDILGAISWLNNNNYLPIVIGGTCSGAFNAAHAIINLIDNKTLEESRVKGLFFDSGWGSVMTMSQSSAIANIQKYLIKTFLLFHNSKKNIAQHVSYKLSYYLAIKSFKLLHFLCAQPLVTQYEKSTNLFNKIHHIELPIFFIHSKDDTHANFSHACKLSTLAINKECWWIEKSSHAKHHLIHKELYKEKLTAFIDNALATKAV